MVGSNIYMNMDKDKLLVTLVYVDDLIFASNDDDMSHEFSQNLLKEFEMLMIGELFYFLGLQVSQTTTDMFISQEKYLKDIWDGIMHTYEHTDDHILQIEQR